MKTRRTARHAPRLALSAPALLLAGGCAVNTPTTPQPVRSELARACGQLAGTSARADLPVPATVIAASAVVAATPKVPEHCQVDGEIGRRKGIDGQTYVIRFRLRMPTQGWNGRFFMAGGGGTNGSLRESVEHVARGYATIGTDGGHDNKLNDVANAGGSASFGVDPQARIDFGYGAYDKVTRVGKALVAAYYGAPAHHAYYVGCSEGGREAMLMTQRFPEHYDGVVAGDPVLHLQLGPMTGLYTTQLFAKLAERSGLRHADGTPAIVRTYSDPDLMLIRKAVLNACDALDGVADGSVENQAACTTERVVPELAKLQCAGTKNDACLTADQIATMRKAYEGPITSKGTQLYADWQWDAGVSGLSGGKYNPSWRSWWIGSYASNTNNAIKLIYATPLAVAYETPPRLPISRADSLRFSLAYDFDRDPIRLYVNSGPYTQSAAQLYFTDSLDLTAFRKRGGKMMIYHGASDSAVSVNDTLRWYRSMTEQMGPDTPSFARMFVVPGMNHCRGGPATDRFDMLPQLVEWVEKGVAPASVTASASNPGYFNASARTRPLCPYPKYARYQGSGDVNVASSFRCE